MPQILAATSNAHKLAEFRTILGPLGYEVLGGGDVGGIPEVDESGTTFAENAILKAQTVAAHTGMLATADDSGLEVCALDGRPGVHSARYGGPGLDDAGRVGVLLRELAALDDVDRGARFVCVIAVATPTAVLGTVEGECRGVIVAAPRGTNGFGYDPVFQPLGHSRTFAELPPPEKDALSHRGAALRQAIATGLLG